MSNKDLNVDALFIGEKSENGELFKSMMNSLIDEHLDWRINYMPQDKPLITNEERNSADFKNTVEHMKDVFNELSVRLRSNSVPWHSPRYWGHMNSETLMPAILAYTYAMLWNGNNVAYESSPATSQMEQEVGFDFAKMFGYKDGWGHIAADGSIANLEGLWYARNLKSIPLAIKQVKPSLVEGKSYWELLNMSTNDILALLDGLSSEEYDAVKTHSARGGENLKQLGKWIVPQTKHYSWLKAADIIGIGLDQIVSIPVDNHYRMKMDELEKTVRSLIDQKTPILGVVGVVGSTEEGAVDPVDKIIDLRNRVYKENGVYFYLHVDAAYGGYTRAMFLDENGENIPYEDLEKVYKEYGVFQENKQYMKEEVYKAYIAIQESESVTVDPHKMGYIPYAAGGIAIRDIRMRNIISYFASYVFSKDTKVPALLGSYILEGSKAGATAAGVWAANHSLPLNVSGYGKLVGRTVEAAHRFYDFLDNLSFNIDGQEIEVHPLVNPDFNIVDWTFNIKGNTNLAKMNELNMKFYDSACFAGGPLYNNDFITSHTDFSTEDYGESPVNYIESLGFDKSEWNKVGKLTLLRACVMTPLMYDKDNFEVYSAKVKAAMKEKLTTILSK